MGLGGRLTLARLASQRIVLAAAAVTIVLATTLLTALWIYVDASATVGLRAAIVTAPESATGIGLRTITGDAAAVPAMDDQVHELLDMRSPGHLRTRRRSCSQMNPPVSSTRRPVCRSWSCCAAWSGARE